MGRQLLKAGTGVAANYRSSCRSCSHTEFAARIGVVLEESDESELWLELLDESRLPGVSVPAALMQESRELRSIFSASRNHPILQSIPQFCPSPILQFTRTER